MIKKGMLLSLVCLLTACTETPNPVSVYERYTESKSDLNQIFSEQTTPKKRIDFYESLARGLKYNLDYRIKLVNTALQAGQLKIAMYTLFPAMNVSGSIYSRNNTYATVSVNSTGQPTDAFSSTPNTIRSLRTGLSWNILDAGIGYVRARQQSERVLIAEEESRKQLQQLSQDVLVAYWEAYSAQELMTSAREFQKLLTHAKNKLAAAILDKTVPQENLLNYQSALLEGNRRLIQLEYKYDKAMLDLKHLINLPPDAKLTLAPPPVAIAKTHNLEHLDFKKLDAITLVSRPELRGQHYQERIAKLGVKTAILQSLPGVTLNEGWNYNSNNFLLNPGWVDRSVDIAWNLLNLVSLPTTLKTAKAQVEYEKLKQIALTMTVLTQTRYAYSHYETMRKEYNIAHQQTENAEALFRLNKNRQLASLASDQQVIVAKLRVLTTKMDENLLLSDLSTALGELYLSAGSDLIPMDIANKPLEEVTKIITHNFATQHTLDFNSYVNFTYQKIFGNSNAFTVQLYGSYHLDEVKSEQNKFQKKISTALAQTKRDGRDWFVLTKGKYTSVQEAQADLDHLPKDLKIHAPWVRKTQELSWVG